MNKTLLTTITVALLALFAAAQPPQGGRSRWSKEMLEAKHQMIIEQVGLTPTQQEQFMPLYEAMEKEIFQNNFEARGALAAVNKRGSAATDDECFQAASAVSQAKVRDGEIESRYFEQFSKILSKRQMFLLKQAESDFARTMMRGARGGDGGPRGKLPEKRVKSK